MPPTPLVIGAVIVLVLISMLAANGLGVIGLARALATVVVVAVVVIPLGFLSIQFGWGEEAHGEAGHAAGDAAHGETLFRTGACPTCHTIQGVSNGTIGPDLTHIATVGATRKPGTSAEAYIRESIDQPSAFIAPGFPNAMPAGQERGKNLDDVVAYLLTRQ